MDEWRRTHAWGGLTRDEIRRARDAGAFAVLPVGACEQHGDHLPVDTDTLAAGRVAMLAAERCAQAFALVLPTAAFGFSPEHAEWPGTISLSLGTVLALVTDVAQSVMRSGFDRLLLVNGHGGNQAPLAAACAALASRGLRVAAVNYWSPGQAEWTQALPGAKRTLGHACAYETGLQLALRPGERERILGRAEGLPPRLVPPFVDGEENPLGDAGASYALLFPAGDPGYYGDPAAASVAAGERLLEQTVAALARFYAAFARARLKVGTNRP